VPPAQEFFCIRHGMFAGRLRLDSQPEAGQAIETFLRHCFAGPDPLPQGGEAVVDELHIVAGWLHRTRTRTQWIYPVCPDKLADVLDRVRRALSSPPRRPEGRSHISMASSQC